MVLTLFGLAGVAGLWAPGWLVTALRRRRGGPFRHGLVDGRTLPEATELVGSAGAEAPVSTQVRPGDGSLRG
jgi:hypothetical protein